jgi:hypothetical protein
MNEQLSEETSLLVIGINSSLDRHLTKLQSQLSPEQFNSARADFAQVMAGLLNIVDPIYRQHPHLKPIQLGGPYSIPPSVLG